MASYEQVLKFEKEKPQGVIRLVEANGFYRAYDHSAFLFHQVIAQHKVTRKFAKNLNQEIVYVGFPMAKLLERIGERSHKKTEFGYDVELKPEELPNDADYDEWRRTVPTEVASRGDVNSLSPHGDELFRAVWGLPTVGFSPSTSEGGRPVSVPAAGNGNGANLNNTGSNGNYWSSTPNSDNSNNAWNLNFNSGNFNRNNNNRNNGQSVRPLRALASASADGASHRLLEDLYRAYLAARRHKRGKGYQIRFEMNQERELVKLRDELIERRYEPRPSSCFIIHDPKMREVFAADFRDRIVHHLFYNYTHEIFERTFIADSYSCIEGRGTHFGIRRLEHHIRSCSQNWSRPCFVLKLDVKGYFMHINRAILLARCREILSKAHECRDKGTFAEFIDYLLEKICLLNPLESCRVIGDTDEWKKLPKDKSLFAANDGCGLPIGNLSSQLFSNIYLGMLDDFVKRELKVRHYGRYVDDVFIVGESKEYLKSLISPIRLFLHDRLGLDLSENKTCICDARYGVEFLGAFVKPFRTYVASRSLRRIRNHLHAVTPRMNARRAQAVVNSSLGVLSHYASRNVREVLIGKSNLLPFGRFSKDDLRFYPNALDWAVYQFMKGKRT